MINKKICLLVTLLSISSFSSFGYADEKKSGVKLKEKWKTIQVTSEAPLPEEISNVTQSKALCREAAIVIGQEAVLAHILKKKTRSGKSLEEAEYPYLKIQDKIRGMVKGLQVQRTVWNENSCTVYQSLPKSELKKILKEN